MADYKMKKNDSRVPSVMGALKLHETLVLTEQDAIAAMAEQEKQADVMLITKVPSGWLYSERHAKVHSIIWYTDWITTFVPEQVDMETWKKEWIGFMESERVK